MIGGVGAGGLLFLQSIIAGRILGPEQFGTFALIQALAMVLLIVCLAGFDMSSSRALARESDSRERRRIAASAIAAVTMCSALALLVVFVFQAPLSAALNVDEQVLGYGIVFTVLLAQRWLMERQLSGLGRFRAQAFVRLGEAVVTIAAFVLLQTTSSITDYRSLVLAYVCGAVAFVIGAHLADGQSPRLRDVSRASARRLLAYSGLMNLSYLFATLLFQADRFAVNRYLGPTELGIYAAYYSATIFIVLQLLLIVSNALYPAMSSMPDKHAFVRRLNRVTPFALIGGFVLLLGTTVVVLAMFGESYPFTWSLALVFAAWASLAGCNGTYAIIVNAHSERSCAREVVFQPVRLIVLIGWFVALGSTDQLTLVSSVVGVLLAELLESANLVFVLRRYVLN